MFWIIVLILLSAGIGALLWWRKQQEQEWMMELTARRISALSSMITGVFPGPTPKAGFPEE